MEESSTTAVAQSTTPKVNGWSLALGILMVFSGMVGIMTPVATTAFTAIFLGWFLVFGGVMQFIGGIIDRKNGDFWVNVAVGIAMFIGGIFVLSNPVISVVSLTFMFGIFFMVDGVSKIFISITKRPARWGWMLTSGIIGVILAFLILTKILASSLILLGTLVGIYVLFGGMELIMTYFISKELSNKK